MFEHRRALVQHGGLAVATLGLLAPWAVIAGRDRDGFSTVELYLTLANDGLPGGLRWLAWLWYLSVLAVVGAWCVLTLGSQRPSRLTGAVSAVTALGGLAGFLYWSTDAVGVSINPLGPILTLAGVLAVAASTAPIFDRRTRSAS